jgi:hypothetical protein
MKATHILVCALFVFAAFGCGGDDAGFAEEGQISITNTSITIELNGHDKLADLNAAYRQFIRDGGSKTELESRVHIIRIGDEDFYRRVDSVSEENEVISVFIVGFTPEKTSTSIYNRFKGIINREIRPTPVE